MEKLVTSSFRLGILGGGQLGRMLALKASEWDIKTHCLDKNVDAPSHIICDEFQVGDVTCYEDVLAFGQKVDRITVESDNVNADALEALEKQGKLVFPKSKTLRIIQDKGLQRQFCRDQNLPVPRFEVFQSKAALKQSDWAPPFIAKTCTAGYDGKGVFSIQRKEDIDAIPSEDILAEEKVDLAKELTVIVSRNGRDETACFPVCELFVHPTSYIVDYLVCPAGIDNDTARKAEAIAVKLCRALEIEGILAVEMFLDRSGNLFINECSPRPHNSGHHTIEGVLTSQYEQHLRGIFNLPLGSCDLKWCSGMINLLGDASAKGDVKYEGLSECLKMKGVKLHIYGKQKVSPKRKMGHITVLADTLEQVHELVQKIKEKVRVTSW